eukprot:TRINITY_DN5997_c0_g1_i3.p1 TRINITY_DN5997_c0_g1~~TRINITY_DN5997_c0_g1_i3.p1  ORF type:complete len:876 (-),score=130.04 TRINITY_DN5997_c0_g1_i3:64-2691(-)
MTRHTLLPKDDPVDETVKQPTYGSCSSSAELPWCPWAEPGAAACQRLGCDPQRGLSIEEVQKRRLELGPNQLAPAPQKPFLKWVLGELQEPLNMLLIGVGVLYSFWNRWEDSVVCIAVIFVAITAEVLSEYRAKKAVERLGSDVPREAQCLRQSQWHTVPQETLVPGDIIRLEAGMVVPADARLLQSFGLEVEQAVLSGESTPVTKAHNAVIVAKKQPFEQTSMVHMGSTVTRGWASAVVTAIGMRTQTGDTLKLARKGQLKAKKTKLQKAMAHAAYGITIVAAAACGAVLVVALIRGTPWRNAVLLGLSLAFATIPEELPILIKAVLGVSALRLARANVLVKQLHAAETLGQVTAIVTDKTGTLTTNVLRLLEAQPADSFDEAELIRCWLNCTDMTSTRTDPLDAALMRHASLYHPQIVADTHPFWRYFPFDADRKRLSVVLPSATDPAQCAVYCRGSPESVMQACLHVSREAHRCVEEATARGYRAVAVARRLNVLQSKALTPVVAERNMEYVGLLVFEDPVRAEAAQEVSLCRVAGITVKMATGDHKATALNVAKEVGIGAGGTWCAVVAATVGKLGDCSADVFARVTAQQKLEIVQRLQAAGHVVLVTGDGTNDAPALAAADVGVAIGRSATDICRASANIVILDDDLGSVVSALREGRTMVDNLRTSVTFYLACKCALVMSFVIALALQEIAPLTPLQIIALELFIDVGGTASFTPEPPAPRIMERPPASKKSRFFNASFVTRLISASFVMLFSCLVPFLVALRTYAASPLFERTAQCQSACFIGWIIGHVTMAHSLRLARLRDCLANPIMLIWLVVSWAAAAALLLLPIGSAFNVVPLSGPVLLSATVAPLAVSVVHYIVLCVVYFMRI